MCAVISGLIWGVVRATVTVPPLVEAFFVDCLALLGGFFADIEGEGEVDGMMPLVWMPAGTGRFVLGCGGMIGGGMGVVLDAGAITTIQSWTIEDGAARF